MATYLKKINAVITLTGIFFSSLTLADSLPKFQLSELIYSASYNGVPIKVTRALTKTNSGLYRLNSSTMNFLGSIQETGTFSVDNQQTIENRDYLYERNLFGSKKTEQLAFDYSNNIAVYTSKDKQRKVTLNKPFHSQISYQLQLQKDLQYGKTEMSYPVIVRGRPKNYMFQAAGEEIIETPLGDINAIKVRRIREDSSRETALWFAPSLEYSLIKLWQREEDDEDFQITIESGTLNGTNIADLISKNNRGD